MGYKTSLIESSGPELSGSDEAVFKKLQADLDKHKSKGKDGMRARPVSDPERTNEEQGEYKNLIREIEETMKAVKSGDLIAFKAKEILHKISEQTNNNVVKQKVLGQLSVLNRYIDK